MTWCIVRPPLVYGPNARGNFPRLVQLIARGWPLPLDSAIAKRSYIALDNLVSFLVATLDAPGAANSLLLASDGEDLSTVDFIRIVAKYMGRNVTLIPVPALAALGRAEGWRRGRRRISAKHLRSIEMSAHPRSQPQAR
jgi:nucleoside-diphosphate-sugar epimerase